MDTYAFDRNTYFANLQSDPKRLVQVEIGDSKQDDFIPQVKFPYWDNEVNASVRLSDSDYSKGSVGVDGDTVIWETENRIARFYRKPGGFEFEVELRSPPVSNVLEFTIQAKGLGFHYQPELTEKEIAEGLSRPDNVIGSYAAYHASKRDNFSDGKNYFTGKAFHIYRPEAIDNSGKRTWCDLRIDSGAMTVTVPQEFLDNASYPVIVDPEFGNTAAGASGANIEDIARLYKATPASSGTLDYVAAFVTTSASKNMQGALYTYTSDTDAGAKIVSSAASVAVGTVTATEVQFPMAASVVSGTPYYLGVQSAGGSGTSVVTFDSVAGNHQLTETGITFPSWSDPFNETATNASTKTAMYGHYNLAGGNPWYQYAQQ